MKPPPPRILLVGIGPHARTFYIPALREMESEGRIEVSALVDIEKARGTIESWVTSHGVVWPRIYVRPFREEMPQDIENSLLELVQKTGTTGIIVSTDPMSHCAYAAWALRNRLHLLLDKPVSTRYGAVCDEVAAQGIWLDYENLSRLRNERDPLRQKAFILCAHRRYHPGFDAALDIVRDASRETNCPVTNLHGYHSDGQWRLPEEILHQDHHSYHHGHGKVSHSGFHFLDTLYRFKKAGEPTGKEPDTLQVIANFVQPDGFLTQLNREDYRRIFGGAYDQLASTPDAELRRVFPGFGEIDAELSFTFLREGIAVALGTASLLHGGFSRRGWLEPGSDLYKGNGRVKHEQHRIHVGPFLCVQIHSYQAKDDHRINSTEDTKVGGNNHFELHVFRNTAILGGDAYEKIPFDGLQGARSYRADRLFIEQVKRGAIEEFVGASGGFLAPETLRSDFDDHTTPVRMMSAVYLSHIRKSQIGNPLVSIPWISRIPIA